MGLGLSLILITHDLSVIAETCDRVMIMYAGRVAEEGTVRVFRSRATRTRRCCSPPSRTSMPTGGRSRSSRAHRRTCATRRPAAASRHAARSRWPSAARSSHREVTFDGVRVACHLYPEGSDGVPITTPGADAIGPTPVVIAR